jgi:hypothetical protein
MATVADFDLLQNTRCDIRTLPWADQERREAMNLHFRVKRAKEEIHRLDIEIPRLVTFMLDDDYAYAMAINRCKHSSPDMAFHLAEERQYRNKINFAISRRLVQTSRLPGFSGTLVPGTRIGGQPYDGHQLPVWASKVLGLVASGEGVDDLLDDDVGLDGDTSEGFDAGSDNGDGSDREVEDDLMVDLMEGFAAQDLCA